jgi:NAD(P)-dependent dehydrogenase (short-subunit alcohol dehydrogenase family)
LHRSGGARRRRPDRQACRGTGASSGIGVETARALAAAGAEVVLAVRDLAAGERTAAAIGPRASAAVLDLVDLDSVRAFVDGWDGPLDILVDNAGIMATPEQHTPQGWTCSSPSTTSGTSR